MPYIDLHDKPFDEGTLAKLNIFENYLKEWLPVFIYNNETKVNICDFFAGIGMDKNGIPGSPLIIIHTLEKFKEQILKNNLNINICLNESDKDKFKALKENVEQEKEQLHELKRLLTIDYFNEDFPNLFNAKRDQLRREANLIFLDQNGIKHVTKDRILELDTFTCTDYLFFSSSSSLKRFEFNKYFPDLHIDSTIDQAVVHRKLLEYFRGHLPGNSSTKLYPFTIKKNANVYGLIFGSKHVLGVEKFLRVAWQHNPVNGEANFDIDDDSSKQQLDFLRPQITKIEAFQRDLSSHIIEKVITTNKDIYFYTLERGFIPKHAKQVLKNMRDDGLLEHFSESYVSYDKIIKEKHIINFKMKNE